MDVNMNDINDILQNLNEESPAENPTDTISQNDSSEEDTSINLSDDDIAALMEENGITEEALGIENNMESEEDEVEEIEESIVSTDSNIPDDTKITPNSPTLLVDESTTRFSGAEWFREIQKARIIVAGIGGIGSNVAFQLARMIPANLTLYDDDVVEMVNMAGQLYSYNDIGKSKVDAIADMISRYTSMRQVLAIKDKFTSSKEPGDIMICGFDNMVARKVFFNSWYDNVQKKPKEERSKCLYLDGRLSMDTLQIFCFTGDDWYNIERYAKEFLFADYEAEETVCSMKQTTYLACMIGSLMVNLFTNFIANQLNPVIPYDLPFFTEYDAQNMLFKTES